MVRPARSTSAAIPGYPGGIEYALAGFLLYGTFDPRPFPNLMAHLEIHGNETGDVPVTPYRCFGDRAP